MFERALAPLRSVIHANNNLGFAFEAAARKQGIIDP